MKKRLLAGAILGAIGMSTGCSLTTKLDNFILSAEKATEAFDVVTSEREGQGRISYQLTEVREEGTVRALYAFIYIHDGHLQVAVYCDNENDIPMAKSIMESMDC